MSGAFVLSCYRACVWSLFFCFLFSPDSRNTRVAGSERFAKARRGITPIRMHSFFAASGQDKSCSEVELCGCRFPGNCSKALVEPTRHQRDHGHVEKKDAYVSRGYRSGPSRSAQTRSPSFSFDMANQEEKGSRNTVGLTITSVRPPCRHGSGTDQLHARSPSRRNDDWLLGSRTCLTALF